MSPRNVLLISYAFPPLGAPESFLSAKTLWNLEGFNVDVISAAPDQGILPIDRSLDAYIEKAFRKVIRLSVPDWAKPLQRFPVFFPDRAVTLNAGAVKTAVGFGLHSYEALITWSQFHSSHLAGLKLKRKYPKLKWIAHFSDPWTDNPFNRFKFLINRWYLHKEREVVRQADHLVFTSFRTADLVMKKYPASFRKKISVIPHPFDKNLYEDVGDEKKTTFCFRYLGRFYGERNPRTLFEALELLNKSDPEILKNVRFEFIGSKRMYSTSLSPNLIQFLPPVDYRTSLKLMSSADVLLVIDAPFDQTVFLPSKLVDYIGAGKPILGITPDGTSKDLIESLGWNCVSPNDPKAIAQTVASYIVHSKQSDEAHKSKKYLEICDVYSASRVRHQMCELLNRLNSV